RRLRAAHPRVCRNRLPHGRPGAAGRVPRPARHRAAHRGPGPGAGRGSRERSLEPHAPSGRPPPDGADGQGAGRRGPRPGAAARPGRRGDRPGRSGRGGSAPMRTTTALLDAQPGIRHGFFGRQGGTSAPPYDSLNMALRTGDRREQVLANRAIVAGALEARELVVGRQVHGTTTVRVTAPWHPDEAPEADALVTTVPGLAIAVTTADCAPILLCD